MEEIAYLCTYKSLVRKIGELIPGWKEPDGGQGRADLSPVELELVKLWGLDVFTEIQRDGDVGSGCLESVEVVFPDLTSVLFGQGRVVDTLQVGC